MKHVKLFEQFTNESKDVDSAMSRIDGLPKGSIFEDAKKNESVSFNNKSTGRDDWDADLKKSGDEFTQFEVEMSPDEFLKRVRADRFTQDSQKIEQYAQQFKRGAKGVPIPTMWFNDKFQYEKGLAPGFHDGSHRVLALKQIGVKKIPVKIIY